MRNALTTAIDWLEFCLGAFIEGESVPNCALARWGSGERNKRTRQGVIVGRLRLILSLIWNG